jgi:multisubunit Na+/H+ antiporter MnhB subunit
LPLGGGTNVVNVMLVDFRAFDTFGEITVLGTVALTIYALLRRFRPPREVSVLPPQQQAIPPGRATDLVRPQEVEDLGDPAQGYLLVPSVLVRLLLPLAMVVALHLFLRGHNQPGGGFVAGLVLAAAFIAQYMVGGTEWVEDRMASTRRGGSRAACCSSSPPASARWPSAIPSSPRTPRTSTCRGWASCTCRAPPCSTPACSRSCSARRCCC